MLSQKHRKLVVIGLLLILITSLGIYIEYNYYPHQVIYITVTPEKNNLSQGEHLQIYVNSTESSKNSYVINGGTYYPGLKIVYIGQNKTGNNPNGLGYQLGCGVVYYQLSNVKNQYVATWNGTLYNPVDQNYSMAPAGYYAIQKGTATFNP